VSPVWNESAELSKDYKKIYLEVLWSEKTNILSLPTTDGFEVFKQALKNHAKV
jgi:hypothetical protein